MEHPTPLHKVQNYCQSQDFLNGLGSLGSAYTESGCSRCLGTRGIHGDLHAQEVKNTLIPVANPLTKKINNSIAKLTKSNHPRTACPSTSAGPAQESPSSEVGLLVNVIVRVEIVSNTTDDVSAACNTLELNFAYEERPSLGYEAVTVSLVFARCTDSCRSHAVTTSSLFSSTM